MKCTSYKSVLFKMKGTLLLGIYTVRVFSSYCICLTTCDYSIVFDENLVTYYACDNGDNRRVQWTNPPTNDHMREIVATCRAQ